MMSALTLTQQYLIGAVNDKGKISTFEQNKMIGLILAAVLELEQIGAIAIEEKKATALTAPGPERAYLMPVYDYIREEAPVKIDKVVDAFYMSFTGKRFTALFDAVMDTLRQAKLTEEVRGGLFGNKESLAPKDKVVAGVIGHIRAELLDDDPVDEETAVVAMLLDKSDALKAHFDRDERKAMKARLQELAASPEGKLVAAAIQRIEGYEMLFMVTTVVN